jgi:hypothetical protein
VSPVSLLGRLCTPPRGCAIMSCCRKAAHAVIAAATATAAAAAAAAAAALLDAGRKKTCRVELC